MSDSRIPPGYTPGEPPDHRPQETFWPYADLPEEPTPEELAAMDPDLHAVLFGATERPFSITLSFPPFAGDDFEQALALARAADEYRIVGSGDQLRHCARYRPGAASKLRELYHLVGSVGECEVLIDDRPVPFARELWLPLVWLLLAAAGIGRIKGP
ncbi:MAG: hypothetical protein F4X11_05055 [Acidobacteria bacterium]|nr:hypothetical protein [Acidobacteriota bacterium]